MFYEYNSSDSSCTFLYVGHIGPAVTEGGPNAGNMPEKAVSAYTLSVSEAIVSTRMAVLTRRQEPLGAVHQYQSRRFGD